MLYLVEKTKFEFRILQSCGKRFSRPHHLKRHIAGVHNREKAKPTKMYIRDDNVAYTTDTVLFTTDEMGETVLIKGVDYLGENESGPFVVQQADTESGSHSHADNSVPDGAGAAVVRTIPKETRQPQFAATSLLQLSQVTKSNVNEKEEFDISSLDISSDAVIEIPGQKEKYVLVNLENNEQRLLPISQLSNLYQE